MAEPFAKHVFVVFRIACRAAIDETADIRRRADEFETRYRGGCTLLFDLNTSCLDYGN
jgi:hypothetical protein